MRLVPVTLREARAFVGAHHRHNKPPHAWKFGVGLVNDETTGLRGVAVAGRPVNRSLDDGFTLEVTRVATDGARNGNSMLYGAILRAAKALGYQRVITYTLDSESGSSLKAVGFKETGRMPLEDWHRPGQERFTPDVLFGNVVPEHDGEKIRWEWSAVSTEIVLPDKEGT